MENVNKLYRSEKTKMIGGVAGGLSEYFNVDVVIFRLLFLLLLLFSGGGLLAYIILWIAIPKRPVEHYLHNGAEAGAHATGTEIKQASRSTLGGIILIFLGTLFLLDNVLPMYHVHDFWPVILVVTGIFLIFPNILQSNSNNHSNTINHES